MQGAIVSLGLAGIVTLANAPATLLLEASVQRYARARVTPRN